MAAAEPISETWREIVATQPDDDNEPLELTDKLDDQAAPSGDDNADDQSGDDDQQQGDDDKPTVSFDGDDPDLDDAQPENSVIKGFRQREREHLKRISELEKSTAPAAIEIGEKPTLAAFDYDEERFDLAYDEWKDRKAAAERQQQSQADESRKANEEWQQDLSALATKKAALQFDDVEGVIETATLSLDVVQQAVIVKAAADPALFLYALGKSEAKRSELAKIQDPIKLAAAVARMEGAVKVTTRKAPAPDRPQRGSAVMPGGGDKELERLEKEADRTGNRTAFIAAKRARKEAEAAKGK